MFDTYIAPRPRTEYVTKTVNVTEQRAPTDESVKLLREMEAAADAKRIAALKLEGNAFKGHIEVWTEPAQGYMIFAGAVFDINGKRCTAKASVDEMRLSGFSCGVGKACPSRFWARMPSPDRLVASLPAAPLVGATAGSGQLHPPIETICVARMQRLVLVADSPRLLGAREDELSPEAKSRTAKVRSRRAKARQLDRFGPGEPSARLADQIGRANDRDEFPVVPHPMRPHGPNRSPQRPHLVPPRHKPVVHLVQRDRVETDDWLQKHRLSPTGISGNDDSTSHQNTHSFFRKAEMQPDGWYKIELMQALHAEIAKVVATEVLGDNMKGLNW